VAVISFSTTAAVDINDLEPGSETDIETKCTLYARLDNLVAKHSPYGYTATHDALQLATRVSNHQLLGDFFLQIPTGALPLDPTGGLPFRG